MYEHRSQALLARAAFIRRQLGHVAIACVMVLGALLIGAAGYRVFEHQRWIDAIYSATMILTGMGPAIELKTDGGKVFATVYALFSSLVFISAAGLIGAPLLHRLLHRLHLDAKA